MNKLNLSNLPIVKNMNGRLKTLLVIVLLLAGVIIGVELNQRKQQWETSARNEGTNITLVAADANLAVGEATQVNVFLDTKQYTVSGMELAITYDPAAVSITGLAPGDFLPVLFLPGNVGNGSLRIVVGSNPDEPRQGVGAVASFTVTALRSGGKTSLAVDRQTRVAAIGNPNNVAGKSYVLRINLGDEPQSSGRPSPQGTPKIEDGKPHVATTSLPSARVTTGYNATVRGYDSDANDALLMTFVNLPNGLTAGSCQTVTRDGGTTIVCIVQGTPVQAGTYQILVNLSDGEGNSEQKELVLTVLPR